VSPFLAQHYSALRLALRRLAGSPLNSLLSILAIGIALALPAGGHVLLGSVGQFAQGAAPAPQITLFMRMDAADTVVRAAEKTLRANDALRAVQFLPRDETLRRMRENASLKEAIEVLGRNPFPDAFVLTARDDNPEVMEGTVQELRRLPGVKHAQVDSAWVRRLNALLGLGGKLVTVLAALLGASVAAITFNIIRLQQLTLRAEIEVSRLLGATEAFIRRPFVYFGALLGLCGALAALALVGVGAAWLSTPISELAALYGVDAGFVGLDIATSVTLTAGATAIGGLGAAISVGQGSRAPA